MLAALFERLAEHRFASLSEVDRYLGADKIECLVCGKFLKSLGRHTYYAHGVSAAEYRVALNIPRNRQLQGTRTRLICSEVQKTDTNRKILARYNSDSAEQSRRAKIPAVIVPLVRDAAKARLARLNNPRRAKRQSKMFNDALNALYGA
jgi:hypothetical protein